MEDEQQAKCGGEAGGKFVWPNNSPLLIIREQPGFGRPWRGLMQWCDIQAEQEVGGGG